MKTNFLVRILTRSATHNPQNSVVRDALHHLGYTQADVVRVERCIVLQVDDTASPDDLRRRLLEDLKNPIFAHLINPVSDIVEVEVR